MIYEEDSTIGVDPLLPTLGQRTQVILVSPAKTRRHYLKDVSNTNPK